MAVLWRIRNWDKLFENNRTRELKHLTWVPLPNKHDGDGYTELMDHPNGAAHFGAWVAIVQVASKCDPRGTLMRDRADRSTPHDASSLSRITRIPVDVLLESITRLQEIGWIESQAISVDDVTHISHCDAVVSHPVATAPHIPALNGMEGNGKEERGVRVTDKPRNQRAVPPTIEEVTEYCKERNRGVDADTFFDFYTANGWVQGKGKPIKDWKAAVRTWEGNGYSSRRGDNSSADHHPRMPTKEEFIGDDR